ncbi:MAG: SET domain-containing protein [Desulfobulbales bacterium]|nr:SET domain-containing protein [Desulfobulbales bacterium]
MLTVKTYLAPSVIHGIGLFAAESIPANTIVWQYNNHIDRVYTEKLFLDICRSAHPQTLQHLLNSSYRRGGRYFYLTDNSRFINHSEFPNIAFTDDYTEVALRKIKADEEILENYLLSYDTSDYFFHEIVTPDPLIFLNSILRQDNANAVHQDLP